VSARGSRRGGSAKRATLTALTALTLALSCAALGGVAWLFLVYPRSAGAGNGSRRLEVTIDGSTRFDDLLGRLTNEHLVAEPRLFGAYVRLLGADTHLRRGTIQLDDRMTPLELARAIATGLGRARVRVTFPEGFTRFDVAARLERLGICDADAFLAASESRDVLASVELEAETAEGYLFPDTYELTSDAEPERVVRKMVRTFQLQALALVEAHPEGLAARRAELGWGMHEVVTLASIVEKEAAVNVERPIIARVFLNRLTSDTFRPRRLQADPTVSYGCRRDPDVSDACRAFDGRDITRAMLRDPDNPYNTYRIEGLPPGPIASPGLDSIRAVLLPADHDYFYFVARGAGRHTFSRTLSEHEAAIPP
jgi:UPF0755 protein